MKKILENSRETRLSQVTGVYEQDARRGEDDLAARIVIAILVHKGYIKRVC